MQTTGEGPLGATLLDVPTAQTPTGERPAVAVPALLDELAARRRRRRTRRLLAAGCAALLAAGLGLGLVFGLTGGRPAPSGPLLRTVTRVVPVRRGTIAHTVTASGTIQPAQVDNLNFPGSGRVTAVNVAVGQDVAAGQVLATIADTALVVQEAGDASSLSAAQAKLAADRASGAPTSQIQADLAAVSSAEAQLTTAKKAVAGATMTSPITGTVASVSLTVGQQVSGSGGSGGSGGSPHAFGGSTSASDAGGEVVVESTDQFVINTTVDDTQVGALAAGQHVIIVPTGSEPPLQGTLTFVGTIAQNGTGIPSFPITITVTGTPTGVYAGSSAQLSILVKQLSNVVEVPAPAVSYQHGRPEVTLVEPGGARVAHRVTVGTTENGQTEITHGLSPGERVVERVETVIGGTGGGSHGNGIGNGNGRPVIIGPAPGVKRVITGGIVNISPTPAGGA